MGDARTGTKHLRLKIAAGILLALLAVWVWINPPGRFGICTFALTTYGGIPRPAQDFQVRCDGSTRNVERTHDLRYDDVAWLLDPMPEVLIISTGWSGNVAPDGKISKIQGCKVRILNTEEAVRAFNDLKRQGRKVAIHVHSTC